MSMNGTPELTLEEATEIARRAIASLDEGHDFVLLEDRTLEREFGWVFRYETKQYLETGDRRYRVPGVGPFVVERDSGEVTFLTTSRPAPRAIDDFEKKWRAERDGG